MASMESSGALVNRRAIPAAVVRPGRKYPRRTGRVPGGPSGSSHRTARQARAVDVAFLPIATYPLYRVPKQSGNRCNLFLVVLPGLPALATACWSAAFLAYLAVYVPYLVAPRADGREG